MREQKIKSFPSFPNAGETKFIANYLYAVRTPLPSGGVGGGLPHSFLFIREGLGVGFQSTSRASSRREISSLSKCWPMKTSFCMRSP